MKKCNKKLGEDYNGKKHTSSILSTADDGAGIAPTDDEGHEQKQSVLD